MKTIGLGLLLACFLVACNSPKNNNTEEQSSESAAEAVAENEESKGFQEMDLRFPESSIAFNLSVEGNELIIRPSGLSESNEALRHDISGNTVVNTEIGDLNSDGFPELMIYLSSHGSGSYGSLIGYSVKDGKAVVPITLPQIADEPKISQGYMGHDEMQLEGNTFCICFPIYKDGDSNSQATGGTRKVQYKLVDGEKASVLEVDKVFDFDA